MDGRCQRLTENEVGCTGGPEVTEAPGCSFEALRWDWLNTQAVGPRWHLLQVAPLNGRQRERSVAAS